MAAYYNEIDEYAAEWLRNLMGAGLIPMGEVDTRSIEDVTPDDLVGFTQCHFFAGVGVWAWSMRQAGWPDDREAWSGSCPCQPFSSAGKGKGTSDERHLWPAQFYLIQERRPRVWFGEQVASKDGLAWLDIVQADLEAAGYACGALDLCAAGFGAPHIRQRQYIAAQRLGDGQRAGLEGYAGDGAGSHQSGRIEALTGGSVATASGAGGLADDELQQRPGGKTGCDEARGRDQEPAKASRPDGAGCGMAEPSGNGRQPGGLSVRQGQQVAATPLEPRADESGPTNPVNGFWKDADWLGCRDGKFRPVRPGTFPLVDGAPARVGRLRAYGNAIVAPQAQAFIEAVMETL